MENEKQEKRAWVIIHLSANEAWLGRVRDDWAPGLPGWCALSEVFVLSTVSTPVMSPQGPAMFRNSTLVMPHVFLHEVTVDIPNDQIRGFTWLSTLHTTDQQHIMHMIAQAKDQAVAGRAQRSGITLAGSKP